MSIQRLEHRFVDWVPEELQAGVLYIAPEWATTSHLCCCGCGHEVALPLDPRSWTLTFDGRTVSMSPSVGNWSLPCRSHYWIDRGTVRWARGWSDRHVELARARDPLRGAGQVAADRSSPEAALRRGRRGLSRLWRLVTGRSGA